MGGRALTRHRITLGDWLAGTAPDRVTARYAPALPALRDGLTRGCFGGVLTSGSSREYGPRLRAPVGRIHWAGAETATRWLGYLDGALEAGERAAVEVLARRWPGYYRKRA